jgi:hypothetical protein
MWHLRDPQAGQRPVDGWLRTDMGHLADEGFYLSGGARRDQDRRASCHPKDVDEVIAELPATSNPSSVDDTRAGDQGFHRPR